MGEVPDAGAPVLQVHIAELSAGADNESIAPQWRPEFLSFASAPPAVSVRSVAEGAFFENDEDVAEIDGVCT